MSHPAGTKTFPLVVVVVLVTVVQPVISFEDCCTAMDSGRGMERSAELVMYDWEVAAELIIVP